eukprot:EC789735.1.p1 GENE.EC789735.1~~EC789735.1.p1  ORF type:complete len:140 (+),score=41.89 EC789735.1:28-447(+)
MSNTAGSLYRLAGRFFAKKAKGPDKAGQALAAIQTQLTPIENALPKDPREKEPEGFAKSAQVAHLGSQSRTREHNTLRAAEMRRIKARMAALAALQKYGPEALLTEAKQIDDSLLPIDRSIFTETPPIPGFGADATERK